MATPARNLSQDNIIRKVYDETTESLKVTGSISVTPTPGAATEAKQDVGNATLATISGKLTPLTTHTVTSIIDTSVTSITNSGYLTVVASTADVTNRIQSIEDIGEFMALYVGGSGSEVLVAALPLGGGDVNVSIPAGSRISIRSSGPNVVQGKIWFNLIK